MKKDTNTSDTASDELEKKPTDEASTDDAKTEGDDESTKDKAQTDDTPTKQELEALKLSEIESTEVAPTTPDEISEDPDKEVKIVRPVVKDVWWKKRAVYIPAGVTTLVLLLLVIPPTRYALLGWAWHKDVVVAVNDSKSRSGVKNAIVTIGSASATTTSDGTATVKGVPLGYHEVVIEKPNYAAYTKPLTVDIFSSGSNAVTIAATGTIVPLTITDRVSGKPVADAVLMSEKTSLGKTDSQGKLDIVLPVSKKELNVTVTSSKHNVLQAKVTAKQNKIELIPTGLMYFLSKQSGKLDVVKANLDGAERKVVIPGAGIEDDKATILLASQDWKYAVLKTKRVPNKPASLYVLTMADDKYAAIDDSNVEFTPVGWAGHSFVYLTNRLSEEWRAGSMQLKSYNAETGKTVILDQNASDPVSTAQNPLYEQLGSAYIADGKVIYVKNWTRFGMNAPSNEGKQSTIQSVKPDGTGKKAIKSYSATAVNWITPKLYKPQDIYFKIMTQDESPKYTYAQLEGETYKDGMTVAEDFNKIYPSYLMSPGGSKSFWAEERDGKQSLFIGDKNANNKQEIATKSEFKPYGWLTDEWLLLQKNGSELYITTQEQLKTGKEPLKVGDYHRPANEILGYGYGGQ